jgi:hypothetical protein
MKKNIKQLNRYTTLPVLLDMLKRKRLVLLDPTSWEDKNDSEILCVYKERRKVQKLFVLCFSYGRETIHHWKTYADGISGCCIEFDAKELIALLDKLEGVRYDIVEYKWIEAVDNATIEIKDIPFTKRMPYRCEEEFRIIWEGDTSENCYEIPFDLQIIKKVTISQRMPDQVYNTIRESLQETIPENMHEPIYEDRRERSTFSEERINRSTLYQNDVWIDKFKKA